MTFVSAVLSPFLALAVAAFLVVAGVHIARQLLLRRSIPGETEEFADVNQAAGIARQLESVATSLRKELASHHAQVARFRELLDAACETDNQASQLTSEADALLGPTRQLATQLSRVYDQIRRQSIALNDLAKHTTAPVTCMRNDVALDDQLRMLLLSQERDGKPFSVALIGMDRSQVLSNEPMVSNGQLLALAGCLNAMTNEPAFVAQYSREEWVVVMPDMRLPMAAKQMEQIRQEVVEFALLMIRCGTTESISGDTARSLLGRADAAFYCARSANDDRHFVHTGRHINAYEKYFAQYSQPAPKLELATMGPSLSGEQH